MQRLNAPWFSRESVCEIRKIRVIRVVVLVCVLIIVHHAPNSPRGVLA